MSTLTLSNPTASSKMFIASVIALQDLLLAVCSEHKGYFLFFLYNAIVFTWPCLLLQPLLGSITCGKRKFLSLISCHQKCLSMPSQSNIPNTTWGGGDGALTGHSFIRWLLTGAVRYSIFWYRYQVNSGQYCRYQGSLCRAAMCNDLWAELL